MRTAHQLSLLVFFKNACISCFIDLNGMDEKRLYNYITLGYTQNPYDAAASFYKGIRQLPPRHFLYFDLLKGEIELNTYWDLDLDATNPSITPDKATEQFRELFATSVNRRLRSDVTVGTSLSGGLDSSSVLTTMQAFTGSEQIKTFSATFPGFEKDESPFIKIVTDALQVTNYQIQSTENDLLADFEKVCYHQEEPFLSAGIISQYQVFELAKQHGVTVLLDGQGADEILAGYYKYYARYWQELYLSNKPLLRTELQKARALGVSAEWSIKNKLAARFPSHAAAFLQRSRAKQQRSHPDLARDFISHFGQSSYATPATDTLNGQLYYNTLINGLGELLQYADRNSMAHGREVRLPFLSHELVEFVFSLPAGLKIREGFTKWILRKAMEPQLPAAIVWRKDKTGYEPPQKQWMEQPSVQDLIIAAKETLVKQGVLKRSVLQKKIQPLVSHAADNYDWRYLVAGTLLR